MRSATILFSILMAAACADQGWIPAEGRSDAGPTDPAKPDLGGAQPDAAPPGDAGVPELRRVDERDVVGTAAPQAILVASGLLQMTFAVIEGSPVEGVSFTIGAVACPGSGDPPPFAPISGKQPLEPIPLPDDAPGDLGGHRFADLFSTVPPGCYEISLFPLDSEGDIVEECSSAHLPSVEVFEGETTEVLAISQCDGEPIGGLDVIAAVNHPPQIEDFWFEPSKFVLTCEAAVLCVAASDPDGDELEFVWTAHADPLPDVGPHTIRHDTEDGLTTHCVELANGLPSSISLTVTIFDRVAAAFGGGRIEDLLAEQGGGTSRDALTVPLHTGTDFTMWCVEGDGSLGRPAGMRHVDKHPSCSDASLSEHFCDPGSPAADEQCPGGEFDPTTVFDPCVCEECGGGVTRLRVRWNGPGVSLVLLKDTEGRFILCKYMEPGQEHEVPGKFEGELMGESLSVRLGNEARFVLPTDCSEELNGFTVGGFEIVDGGSEAGDFCVFPPDPGDESKP